MPQIQWVTNFPHKDKNSAGKNVLVDKRLASCLNNTCCAQSRNKYPESLKQTFISDNPHSDQNCSNSTNWQSIIDICILNFKIYICDQSTNSHLPESTDRKIECEFWIVKYTHNTHNEWKDCIEYQNNESFLFKDVETNWD